MVRRHTSLFPIFQDEVELAVISIPSAYVLDTVVECGEKGVKALIIISAGFKETGHEGADCWRKRSLKLLISMV